MDKYIKIPLDFLESYEGVRNERTNKSTAFLELILGASHFPESKVIDKIHTVNLLEGQIYIKQREQARKWKWSPVTVLKFLRVLEAEGSIKFEPSPNGTMVTILNWEKYSPDVQVKPEKKVFEIDSVEYKLSRYLFGKMKENNPKVKEPNFQLWSQEFDYIIRIDTRTPKEIVKVIDYSQGNHFWKKNILSPRKLRYHFDRLTMSIEDTKNTVNHSSHQRRVPLLNEQTRDEV